MKKYGIVFLAVLALLVSCKHKYENYDIVGDWVSVKSASMDPKEGFHEEATEPVYLSIFVDNKYTMKYQNLSEEGTYILQDNTLTFNKKKGGPVLLVNGFKIIKLNSHELTLRFIYPYTQNTMYDDIFFIK